MREYQPAFRPDQRSLLSSALGMGPPPQTVHRQKLQVAITLGDLATTSRAVAVGHYSGDTIVGPEAYLDRVLGTRLRRCHSLGLYPGELGTNGIFFNPNPQAKPKGAVVIGLGKVGELTAGTLADSFSLALLAYCRDEMERQPAAPDGGCPSLELPVTTLLIGTGAGGIGVEESLAALLRGTVRANDSLQKALDSQKVRITRLRVIELWEETAIQAAHALAKLERDPELAGRLVCDRTLTECAGGKRGPRSLDDPDWWQRLKISAPVGKPMRFTSLTRRARAEQDLLATQEAMVDRFIADAIGSVHHGPETSRTLYEMLLPNRLKDGSEMRGKLVLVLDERSARFPWEMLEDRWSKHSRPPAVEYGIIRQLTTQTFRKQPVMAMQRRALVIGDPRSNFVPLRGARREAEAVAARLSAQGYQVSALIHADARAIVTALHADAYQILHLAGHGVHRQAIGQQPDALCNACGQQLPVDDETLVSGMIIGNGMVLTPADVEQRARYHARWALALYRSGEEQQAKAEFETALDALNGMQVTAKGWLGGERYRSLTGIYSRRVQTLPPTERKADLENIIAVYDLADAQMRARSGQQTDTVAETGADSDPLDVYSRMLWLTAQLMLTAYSKQTLDKLCPDFDQRCARLVQRARNQHPGDGGFWSEATAAEIRVLQALQQGQLGRQVAAEVTRTLRDAMNRGVSQRQKSSLLNNFDLLYALCSEATVQQSHFRGQAAMLAGIRDALGGTR